MKQLKYKNVKICKKKMREQTYIYRGVENKALKKGAH